MSKMKKLIMIIGTFLLISVSTYGILGAEGKKESPKPDNAIKDGEMVQVASQPVKEFSKHEETEKFLGKKVKQIVDAPEQLELDTIRVVEPPTDAIKDKEKVKKFTRVNHYYKTNDNKKSLVLTQSDHKIIPESPAKDKEANPLNIKTEKIGDQEINFYDCNCSSDKSDSDLVTYYWYEGEKTYLINAMNMNHQKVMNTIGKLLKQK
jgi:hypothetical protein